MWQYTKLTVGGLFLLAPIFMMGYFIWDSRLWYASAMLFTFIAIVYTFISGFNPEKEVISPIVLLIVGLSSVQIFISSDVTDKELQQANIDLFMEFAQIDYCPPNLQPNENKRIAFKELKEIAFIKCGMQGHSDMLDLTFDFAKANYLPTELGLIDTIHTEFFKDTKRVKCIEFARAADKLCPNLLKTELSSFDSKVY